MKIENKKSLQSGILKIGLVRPCFFTLVLIFGLLIFVSPGGARAETVKEAFETGFKFQREMRTLEAIKAYKRALKINPFHPRANYEIGWSYWVLRKWKDVVRHWEVALKLKVKEPQLEDYLTIARNRLGGKIPPLVQVAIGTKADETLAPGGSPLSLKLVARFQHYNPNPTHQADKFDPHVFSPKQVVFSLSGNKVYVNALEGFTTLVYDTATLLKRKVIHHRFGAGQASLFDPADRSLYAFALKQSGAPPSPDIFEGKPVEAAFTHKGKYLWISYYRRSFDKKGIMPSAVAVVDTAKDKIVRVIYTGPIPKSIITSPDSPYVAIAHWGDNTIALIDASGDHPRKFHRVDLVPVGKPLALPKNLKASVNRDHYCGFCLRGGVFSKDGAYLLVGRMGGGGIAVIDVAQKKHVGTVWGMKPTPRHQVLSPDGSRLYVSSSASGYVSVYQTKTLIAAAVNKKKVLKPLLEARVGRGPRTIALTPDGTTLYVAVNKESKIVVLDAKTLMKRLEISADSFPVGLAISPDGNQLWVTAQGARLRGGNSVMVYKISKGG